MALKIVCLLCIVVSIAFAIPAQPGFGFWPANASPWAGNAGANPWIPPWVASAPWFTAKPPCDPVGAACLDCNTKSICTKLGAFQIPCNNPSLPYCNLGKCSAEPSAECAPESETTNAV